MTKQQLELKIKTVSTFFNEMIRDSRYTADQVKRVYRLKQTLISIK